MRVDPREFQKLELRCHGVLADVSLHDVWAIPLAGGGPGRTVSDVRAVSPIGGSPSNIAVRGLVALRRAVGRRAGWDRERDDWSGESYVHRLSDEDRSRSLIAPGTREGSFRLLYLFPNEALAEVRNATVHAFLATVLVARAGGYTLYWAIYVKPVGPLTPVYMAIIDPFRRFVVYPALIRQTQAAWSSAYR
jgi:Protein of unknown function (DUF2867)